ncbi:MAG: WD40 repeat domain-containing protein [Phycisphaerae bacterium]
MWDVETGEQRHELTGFVKLVETVAWSLDSSIIAAGGYRHEVALWRMPDGSSLPPLRLEEGAWRSRDLRFTSDGERLIIANSSGYVSLWDLEHQQEIMGLGFISGALGIAVPDDLRWIALAARWEMTVWDTALPHERVIGEVVKRRYDESPDDWKGIGERIAVDRWLTDSQKTEAAELVEKLKMHR